MWMDFCFYWYMVGLQRRAEVTSRLCNVGAFGENYASISLLASEKEDSLYAYYTKYSSSI